MNFIPSDKEKDKLENVCVEFVGKLNILLKKFNAKAIVGGSVAKGTWLSNNHDIDLFVLFDKKNKDISKILHNSIKNKFKVNVIHGSRDYYNVMFKGYNFEIIPVLKINNIKEAENIMDASPFHIKWVKSNINELSDDVRRAKAFCIAQRCYGAETYIRGFSGYVLEILTIYYGGFSNLIKNAAKWKGNVAIDVEKYGSYKLLNESKINSRLIVIDPVQEDRNAAAALSNDKLDRFIESCKKYLKDKSDKFFEEVKINDDYIKSLAKEDYAAMFHIKPTNERDDVAGAKVVKVLDYIKRRFLEEDFTVLDVDFEFGKDAIMWLIVKKENLSKYKRHYGPPVKIKDNAQAFMRKWKNAKIENGRLYVDLNRKYRNYKDLAKSFVRDKYILNNVSKITF